MYITRLSFYYFSKVSTPNSFPDFGISYGVFGRFGRNQGFIYTDDEDTDSNNNTDGDCNFKGNHNYLKVFGFVNYDVSNCVEGGPNTRLYMSKVNNSNNHDVNCTYP